MPLFLLLTAQVTHGVHKNERTGGIQLAARPAGVVGHVVEGLGVGHKTQHPARGVGQARNGKGGAIGVERILLRMFARCGVCVLQGDEVFFLQAAQAVRIAGNELAFAVAHGHGEQGQIFGEHAGACRIG